MPFSLDFDHISGPFRSIGRFLLKPIAESFERLGKWLQDRVKKVDQLDLASRGYPIVEFYNDAVSLWLHEIQWGALSPDGNPPGFLDQMRRAGQAFVDGFKRIPEAIENVQILPRLFATAKAALEAIERSMDRFQTPTPQMFDPRIRKASDLLGEAALAWRALNSSRGQVLKSLFREIGPVVALLLGRGGGKEEGVDPNSTSDLLDGLARYIVGGLLVLIALPELVSKFWEVALFLGKSILLDKLAGVEEIIFGLRRTLIDKLFVRLRDTINTGLAFIDVALDVLIGQFSFWAGFVEFYGGLLLNELGGALRDLVDYLSKTIKGIVDIFVSKSGSIATLNKWLLTGVLGVLGGEKLISKFDPFDFSGIGARLAAARKIGWILHWGPDGPRKSTHKPDVVPPFPNIGDEFLGGVYAKNAGDFFQEMARTVPDQLRDISDAASIALQKTSLKFEGLAAAAARGGAPAEFTDIAKQAAANAEVALGPETKALREHLVRDSGDQVAASFEQFFAVGGLETLAASLKGYIPAMLDTFRKQEEAGEDITFILKTSPAILAKKAVLGRAIVQKISVDATGRQLDDALVTEIAVGFRTKVVEAYRQGRQQILDVAASVK